MTPVSSEYPKDSMEPEPKIMRITAEIATVMFPSATAEKARWNPAEMQQRFMTAIKEQLKATDEDWKVIEPRLKAVMDKEQAARQLSSRGGFFRRGGQNDQPAAEVAAVTKAIEGGDAATIKTALAALRKARTDREAETTKAKDALREVLTVAQEAQLVLNGLLN